MIVTIRDIVQRQLTAMAAQSSPLPAPEAIDDEDLLETFGLDSVAFAELLTRLEEETGYLPPAILEGDYPETFGELVAAWRPSAE